MVAICLSISISLESLDRSSLNFLCVSPVALAWSSSSGSTAIRYVLRFLCMMSWLPIMCPRVYFNTGAEFSCQWMPCLELVFRHLILSIWLSVSVWFIGCGLYQQLWCCVMCQVLMNSKLPVDVLGRIWELSDVDDDGFLDCDEFILVWACFIHITFVWRGYCCSSDEQKADVLFYRLSAIFTVIITLNCAAKSQSQIFKCSNLKFLVWCTSHIELLIAT